MRHTLPLLLSAAALVSPVGCIRERTVLGVGGGWADDWSVPASMVQPDRYSGVNVSFAPFIWLTPTLGLHYYFDGDDTFTAPYITYDLGAWAAMGTGWWHCWPVLKPLIGGYHWSESPEETGLLTGLSVGAGMLLYRRDDMSGFWLFAFEYGWFNAHDTIGDHDARFETGRIALDYVW
jgi:hypothetical protein